MQIVGVQDLVQGGGNAPINPFYDLDATPKDTAARLQRSLPGGHPFDSLVVNRGTSTMVVALHGATNRESTILPRFEWLRSMLDLNVTSVFFGDPTLHLSPRLSLAWYTGWDMIDVHSEIALESTRIAEALGVSRIIFMGASGGGFAALQTSALLPGSEALAFNAQTDIARYRVNGEFWGAQRDYIATVWPRVWESQGGPEEFKNGRWAEQVDDRVSALRRYSIPRPNLVHLVQNEEEFHYEDHFLPFMEIANAAGNAVEPHTNLEGHLHNPPRSETFQKHIRAVLAC